MKFYDETKPLYIETDASGVGLRASLPQKRSGTCCHRYEAPDNNLHRPIVFASLSIVKEIHQHRKRSTRYTLQSQKNSNISSL